MHPFARYQVQRNLASRQWEVRDSKTGNVLAGPWRTEREARVAKNLACMAFWHGADGVKHGEVIL